MATKKYKCKVCGYIYEGESAPEKCPVCQAPSSEFEEIKTKRFTKESNAYIFIYTTIIIVIVSLLLSITSGILKERQMKNVETDKKKQILSSLNLDLEGKDIAKIYEETITKFVALDADGQEVKDLSDDFNYEFTKEELPLYVAQLNGETKYIIPLKGAGLWGAIWGYVALNEDKNTIYGIFFSHAGETPGLGANIASEAFQSQFKDKHIMDSDNNFVSIAIVKAGQTAQGQDQVDAISGGTITSKGVESMLISSIGNYTAFLNQMEQKSISIDDAQETETEQTTNEMEENDNEIK